MHITRQARQNLLCPAEETRPQSSSELKVVVLLTSLMLDLVCDLFTSLVHMTEWSRYLVRWTVFVPSYRSRCVLFMLKTVTPVVWVMSPSYCFPGFYYNRWP